MRSARIVRIAGAAAIVILTACGGVGSGAFGQENEAGARAFFDHGFALFHSRDWHGLYDGMSPRYRASCDYSQYLQQVTAIDATARVYHYDLSKMTVTDVHVTVDGDTSRITYTWQFDGADFSQVTASDPDIYRFVAGRWYDDNKGKSGCAFS